ncbi:hypothetical protein BGZ96_007592 [Linnemannia gamsii]|uniref:Uncharacterized protein n=1 Tax=Linnemannia gamsii TaxID=64522 RepID=A0ABQ7JZX8_9FUNG|nr:hypothetical protein BGZ96_007592 [Linnemannia gamsii]
MPLVYIASYHLRHRDDVILTLVMSLDHHPPDPILGHPANRLAPTLLGVSMKQSRAIQRKVYAQLGQLHVLRYLDLGANSPECDLEVGTDRDGKSVFFDRRMQLSCLEMTLESGLDLLSGLRDLKRLTVANMDHRIGVAEMLWMSKAWPNIYQVKGLVSRREGGDLCGRMVPSVGSVIGPGRDCGSKMDVLSCGDLNFEFSAYGACAIIRSVFRPDISTDYHGYLLQDYDKSLYHPEFYDAVKLVQRSHYIRLAALESLQILTLGHNPREDTLISEFVRSVAREDPRKPWERPWAVEDPDPSDVGSP